MPGRRIARPHLLLALVAALAAIVCAWLGSWQLGRAAEKLALQRRLDMAQTQVPVHLPAQPVAADTLAYQRVEALGEFRPELTVLLDNRVQDGVVGYEVITPLRLTPGDLHVLVNRGWVRALRTRRELPAVVTPAGKVRVEGIALPPSRRYLELSSQTVSGAVWQNLDLERFAATYQIALQPIVLQQRNDTGDGVLRTLRRADAGADVNRAYAWQWFAMSLVIAIAGAVLLIRSRNTAPRGLTR
jgi:surfeit locus 1 family protein